MIVTLTLNPAVDRNILVDRLVFEDRAYILSRDDSPGGRGINASRVIHAFGGETLAILPAGGKSGAALEKLLAKQGFPFELVRINEEIRINFTISDKQGLTIKLNELGPPMTPEEVERIEEAVTRQMPKAKWLMLCGSIPPGVPDDFYCKLIELAGKHNVATLLDTDGDALQRGVEARPTVVTPNQQEAERLLGRALITRTHFLEAVSRIEGMGAESVLLSLGARGAIAAKDGKAIEVIPPRIEAISPIGAGDAMAAAFVWAMSSKNDFADAARWAVATGTASTRLAGTQFATMQQARQVYKTVELKPVS